MAYDDRDDDNVDDLDVRKHRGDRPDVPTYLMQSILVTLCCCLPLGIVAIVHASKVNTLLAAGDYDGAVKASAEANKWGMIGLVAGLIVNGIYFVVQIAALNSR